MFVPGQQTYVFCFFFVKYNYIAKRRGKVTMTGDRGNFLEEKDIATVRNGIEAQKFIKSVTKIVKKIK